MIILDEIFKGSVGEVTHAFIEIIVRKGRERQLKGIANAFVVMAKEYKNIYAAQVTSARPLDDSAKAKVMAAVGQIQPGTIELEEKLDDKLIGGFTVCQAVEEAFFYFLIRLNFHIILSQSSLYSYI